jgi:hypothetical protein
MDLFVVELFLWGPGELESQVKLGIAKKDLMPLQSKFFPAKFFFCILEKETLAGKSFLFKKWIYLAKKVFPTRNFWATKFMKGNPTSSCPPPISVKLKSQSNFPFFHRHFY